MKKQGVLRSSLILVSFFAFLFLMQGVFAYTDWRGYSQKTIDTFVEILEPVFQAIFGGTSWDGTMLFEKLLIFIVLVALVYLAMGNIPVLESGSKRIRWTIAVVVPLIGVRFLDYAWLMAIIFQYKLLAIVLAGLLPFVLFFFFIHNVGENHDLLRKIGWVFFIVVYLGLWLTVPENTYADIYFWTLVAAFAFLLFDGTIHHYLMMQELKRAGSDNILQHISKIDGDIDEINKSRLPDKVKQRLITKKEKEREWWYKKL